MRNQNHPLVSIVTPSLNAARTLPRLISCLEQQSYPLVEHIIVDGLSTDGTAELLNQIDPKRHRVLRQKDHSMYEAINRGLSIATGDILAYLNSDDLYFPGTIKAVTEYFIQHPKVDIIFGDCLSVNLDGDSFVIYLYSPWQPTLSRLSVNKFLGQPSVFWRRRVWNRLGPFDDTLRFVADFDWWLRAAKTGLSFAKINKILSIDCRSADILRNRYTQALEEELAEVRKRYLVLPAWHKQLYERRNYWEDIFINKLAEYNLANRWLTESEPAIIFHQDRYRASSQGHTDTAGPILQINLPYFVFNGYRIEGR